MKTITIHEDYAAFQIAAMPVVNVHANSIVRVWHRHPHPALRWYENGEAIAEWIRLGCESEEGTYFGYDMGSAAEHGFVVHCGEVLVDYLGVHSGFRPKE